VIQDAYGIESYNIERRLKAGSTVIGHRVGRIGSVTARLSSLKLRREARRVHSIAVVTTTSPERYAKQLVSHLGHKATVEPVTEMATRLRLAAGVGVVRIEGQTLVLEADAPDADALDRVQDVLGRHLVRFGRRDELHVNWTVLPDSD